LIFAGVGGLLFGFGAELGRGCTSGSALSGDGSSFTRGFISMMAIFGTAYAWLILLEKNWI